MTKTFAYLRVSTARQAEEGESLGAQERVCAGYCQMHGLTIDTTLVERGVSGSIPLASRAEGSRLLTSIQAGDHIVAAKLDRLFRSANDALVTLEQFKSQGVHLHLLDLGGDVVGNGVAKLVFTVLAAVAEAERDRIRERIADVKADQKGRSRYLGGRRPFGFAVDVTGALIPIEEEQAAIARMIGMRRDGVSLRAITEATQAAGFELSHEGVRAALSRAATINHRGGQTVGVTSISANSGLR